MTLCLTDAFAGDYSCGNSSGIGLIAPTGFPITAILSRTATSIRHKTNVKRFFELIKHKFHLVRPKLYTFCPHFLQHKIKGAPAEDAPVSLSETSLLHSVTQQRQLIVDYTQQTQQYDTCTAETQTESHGSIATERSDRCIAPVDEHGLYHQ